MVFVTDTHAIVWYLMGDSRIGKKAKSVFSELEKGKGKLIISVIVLLETLVLIEKKRVKFSWIQFNEKISQFPTGVIYPVGVDLVYKLVSVDKTLDLHDRILAATTNTHRGILITKDEEIKRTKTPTVW